MLFLARHINLFKQTGNRGRNDADNKIRESFFLLNSHHNKEEILKDPEYGAECRELYGKFEDALQIRDCNYLVQHMAGRKYNYDFLLKMEKNGEKTEKKIEFKNNAKTISKLPQIIQINTGKFEILREKYHDWFYDGSYLSEIIALNDGLTVTAVPIPTKEEYMKNIMNTNYQCNSFIQYLKETEEVNKPEKQAIVKRSIMDYLTKHGEKIDIEIFKQKIIETQSDKEYLLYHTKNRQFTVEKMDMNLDKLKFDRIKNNNTIVLKTEKNEFGILLRWKNHIGILHPAWQVSVKPIKEPKKKVPKEPKQKVPKVIDQEKMNENI
jgi:hypothetical protein